MLSDTRSLLSDLSLDYALLDLKVGRESSLEFIAEIKQTHPNAPIVLITGYGSIATAVQAMKLGAVNYLTKPCSVEQILGALKNNAAPVERSEEYTSELQSRGHLVCRLLLEKK